jgi:hypothetical protein
MYRVGWPIYAHSSITACADAVCGRTLPRHAVLGHPISPFRARRQRQQYAHAPEGAEARADVVLVNLKLAVEQYDRKRARGPIVAAMRELGWSACSGHRASMASSGTGAAASSSR